MQNLKSYVLASSKPVYVHLATMCLARQFLRDAENQGFMFSDGKKPTEKDAASFFAIRSNLTMNYIGTNGRVAYQANSDNIVRLEYDHFVNHMNTY